MTGLTVRRQGDSYFLAAIYDYGTRAVARGVFKGSATEMTTSRVLGYDDLTTMFAGTVVEQVAIDQLADRHIRIKRTCKLSADGKTVEVSGETIYASVNPNGTLQDYGKQDLAYKSLRQGHPAPCERERRAIGWEAFKAEANAWRDLKAKPALPDEVREHHLLGLDAVNSKNFDAALDKFEAGLELDPLWANGHYNAAMVYAQELDFDSAAYHMRAYLELTPATDKDFQANKDRLLLWEGKLKQQLAQQPEPIPED